jgi:5-methylcytosine-specific restriction endonuclease McrBC GTP-binding regulatory subunit McrB
MKIKAGKIITLEMSDERVNAAVKKAIEAAEITEIKKLQEKADTKTDIKKADKERADKKSGIKYQRIIDSYNDIIVKGAFANSLKKEGKRVAVCWQHDMRKPIGKLTLIEEDKRLGKNEALEVILPYSKEKFGVPSNLHIIGTMNTADRSVEALDTALRRRFSFVEMMPEYESLNKIQFDDFHLGELLKTINSRIEALLDRDHTIGHSYFINIKPNDTEALKEAFANKIIPLLQEYFYHDYEKIALILGEGFVECIEPKESKVEFARWNGKTLEKPETSRLFKIKKLDDNFNILDSIKHLLNRVAI